MIEICFITDSTYVLTTMVAIKSLILNNKKEKFCINVICYKLNDSECRQILKLKTTKNVDINIIDASNKEVDIGNKHFYVSKCALLKFYMPQLFKDKDKILYLDGDILVKTQIKDLYDTNLDNVYAAAVKDIYASNIDYVKKQGIENYFNSGVMLLNLKKMREDNISEKLFECKRNETDGIFVDQNCFNLVFGKNVRYLSLKYNCIPYAFSQYSDNEIANFYKISKEELQDIKNHIAIIHLANFYKPWKYTHADCFKEFALYLFKLPNCELKKSTIDYLFGDNWSMRFKYYLRQYSILSSLIDVYEKHKLSI